MFQNRIQISRLSSVDGLVCNAGNLELDRMPGVPSVRVRYHPVLFLVGLVPVYDVMPILVLS